MFRSPACHVLEAVLVVSFGGPLAACSDSERDPLPDSDSDAIESFGDDDDDDGAGQSNDDDDDDDGGDDDDDGGDDDDSDCGVEANVTPSSSTIMLLVDQSGSMNESFDDMSRWEALRRTLHDTDDGLVPRLSGLIRFGQMLYTSREGNLNGGTCPLVDRVDPNFDSTAMLASQFDAIPEAGTDTPTGESIDAAVAAVLATTPAGEAAIVLATDGEPDTCAQPDPQMGQADSVAAAERAFAAGIKLFIVSVGGDISDDHLQDVANAGIGLEVGGSENAPFFRALRPDDLVDAFEEIAGSVVSCRFEIGGTIDSGRYCEGTVLLDGMPITCDEDWTVEGESTLRILGSACDVVQNGQAHDIDAEFPCDVLDPVE